MAEEKTTVKGKDLQSSPTEVENRQGDKVNTKDTTDSDEAETSPDLQPTDSGIASSEENSSENGETPPPDTADGAENLEIPNKAIDDDDETEKTTENGEKPDQNMDTVRADEYEQLAKLCLDKEQPQLALEYAGKATKIRQELLGDSHPVTVQSLDFFASVYAKVGQEQYQESMKKLSTEGDENNDENIDLSTPVSILRKRKTGEKEEKKVRFDVSQVQNLGQDQESDETLAKRVLWALLIICCLLLVVLASYLYCKLSLNSVTCGSIRTNIYYTYMRIKYYYYHYSSSAEGTKYT
ncbi:uncharacterized protein [Argopecten irradians]|uniref:uncharacterized protein n=1 Tax=Argopecten irradians TaxID=31199 RepID=UPI003715E855